MNILCIPGLNGSGAEHWQSLWAAELPACRKVDLESWSDPDRTGWIARIDAAVNAAEDEVVLVAHSLGCLAVAWWAAIAGHRASRVRSALLVAPADADSPTADPRIRRFAPVPRNPLPFPAIVVASRDDPYAGFARCRTMARDWSARFHDAGARGHINVASSLGNWPDGLDLLASLTAPAFGRPHRLARRA